MPTPQQKKKAIKASVWLFCVVIAAALMMYGASIKEPIISGGAFVAMLISAWLLKRQSDELGKTFRGDEDKTPDSSRLKIFKLMVMVIAAAIFVASMVVTAKQYGLF